MVRRVDTPFESVVNFVVDVTRHIPIGNIELKLICELMRRRVRAQRNPMPTRIQRAPDHQHERDHSHAEIGEGDLRQGFEVHWRSSDVMKNEFSLGRRRERCNAPVLCRHPIPIGVCP